MDLVLSSKNEQALFDLLRAKRLELARAQSFPPYVIFHDRTLVEMAKDRPRTQEAMASIVGVGEAKLAKYGDTFLKLLHPDPDPDAP